MGTCKCSVWSGLITILFFRVRSPSTSGYKTDRRHRSGSGRHRPSTAPSSSGGMTGGGGGKRGRDTGTKVKRKLPKIRRPRSPSHPNYKEDAYNLSTVVMRYVGHPDHYLQVSHSIT